MSWSVSAVGKPAAVAAKLAADFARIKCTEPEETIKNTVANAVAVALASFPVSAPVSVEASGSQSVLNDGTTNQLNVAIKPLWGFIE